MTILTKPALILVLTAGLAACASQPSGPPASTTSQSMALPPATTAAAPPAAAMTGMDHSRMSPEEHRRMMQPRKGEAGR
jgi:hypothetical protein